MPKSVNERHRARRREVRWRKVKVGKGAQCERRHGNAQWDDPRGPLSRAKERPPSRIAATPSAITIHRRRVRGAVEREQDRRVVPGRRVKGANSHLSRERFEARSEGSASLAQGDVGVDDALGEPGHLRRQRVLRSLRAPDRREAQHRAKAPPRRALGDDAGVDRGSETIHPACGYPRDASSMAIGTLPFRI